MEVTITKKNDDQTLVEVSGRLDTTNVPEFERMIAPLMNMEKPNIIIECNGFEYISSAGLRIFLMLQKSVMAKNGKLTLCNMRPEIQEVFDMTGFSAIFTIE